ncbi:MAG TPA: hypothetical protein VNU48_04570 [Burkholderiaceae bacterium]|nr:hypothetical protein [Burkholderiaceae bacterium]
MTTAIATIPLSAVRATASRVKSRAQRAGLIAQLIGSTRLIDKLEPSAAE